MKKSTIARLLYASGAEESDARYATGLHVSDPYFLLVVRRKLHLLISELEAARAAATCPKAAIHTPTSLKPRKISASPFPSAILALLHKLGIRQVAVGTHFPVGIAKQLEEHGVTVTIDPSPPFPQRAIKTETEIAAITRAQHAAVAAMRAAVETIRAATAARNGTLKLNGKTLTSEALKLVIERTLLDRGCSANGTIVAIGPQGAQPHHQGTGPVRAGVPVVIDIFPRHKESGYWGDITRTVVHGIPSPEARALYRAVLAAQKFALGLIKPGAKSRDIQLAVQHHFQQAGYETRLSPPGKESGFIHSVGHGVGLDIHEAPGLRNQEGQLAAGNVVTVEPGLYYPEIGGVRIEDTVVVTPAGCKILATYPKKFEILPA